MARLSTVLAIGLDAHIRHNMRAQCVRGTWGFGVEGGLVPGQAAPHLPEAHDSQAVTGRASQHEKGLQGLLVQVP